MLLGPRTPHGRPTKQTNDRSYNKGTTRACLLQLCGLYHRLNYKETLFVSSTALHIIYVTTCLLCCADLLLISVVLKLIISKHPLKDLTEC